MALRVPHIGDVWKSGYVEAIVVDINREIILSFRSSIHSDFINITINSLQEFYTLFDGGFQRSLSDIKTGQKLRIVEKYIEANLKENDMVVKIDSHLDNPHKFKVQLVGDVKEFYVHRILCQKIEDKYTKFQILDLIDSIKSGDSLFMDGIPKFAILQNCGDDFMMVKYICELGFYSTEPFIVDRDFLFNTISSYDLDLKKGEGKEALIEYKLKIGVS